MLSEKMALLLQALMPGNKKKHPVNQLIFTIK